MGWGWGSSEESPSLCGRGQRPLYFWRVGEGSQQESAARLSDPQGGREAGKQVGYRMWHPLMETQFLGKAWWYPGLLVQGSPMFQWLEEF